MKKNLPGVFGNLKNIDRRLWLAGVVLLFFAPGGYAAADKIEVFTNGGYYPSIEAYKASKEPKSADVLKERVPSSVQKITQVISDATAKEWKMVGIEHGVGQVVVDFNQDWENPVPKFKIEPRDLQGRMESLLDGRKAPVLVVAGDNKLRVMELKRE